MREWSLGLWAVCLSLPAFGNYCTRLRELQGWGIAMFTVPPVLWRQGTGSNISDYPTYRAATWGNRFAG
jgi:hypothetical protein